MKKSGFYMYLLFASLALIIILSIYFVSYFYDIEKFEIPSIFGPDPTEINKKRVIRPIPKPIPRPPVNPIRGPNPEKGDRFLRRTT